MSEDFVKTNGTPLPPSHKLPPETPLPEDMLPYAPALAAARSRRGKLSSRLLLYAVCLTFFALLAWAAFAELDEVVSGAGQVIPSQRVQHIQNLEGGILREILVYEGQEVQRGDILLRIDNEQAGSLLRDTLARSHELEATIARLEAEINGTEPQYPESVLADPELVARHNSLLEARRTQSASERKALEAQLELRRHEVQEQIAKRRSLQSSLTLATRQRDMAKDLLATRSFSEMEFLNLEQRVSSLQGDLQTLNSSIPRSQSAVREAEERLNLLEAQSNAANMEELNKATADLATLREALAAGEDRVTRTEVRSPVHGLIKSINITTEGGVIMPGEVIMDVVPVDDSLIIEAHIHPQDIAFLKVGQPAKVRLSSYDFSIYGALDAVLENIGADTVEGRMGDIYYVVKLRAVQTAFEHNGQVLRILPGMMGSVDIITGKKTVLDYILKPIFKAQQTALRER